ncbi:MAG: ankyrin repeat domain-containing protein [Thermoproteus sp.]
MPRRRLDEQDEKLLLAAAWGYIGEVRRLIEKGADINAIDKDGHTPLYRAALEADAETSRRAGARKTHDARGLARCLSTASA